MPLLLALLLTLPPAGGFTVTTVDGVTPGVAVRTLAPDWRVNDAPAGTLVALKRSGVALPPVPRGACVVLANGDRVAGTAVGGDRKTLRFRPTLTDDTWPIPVSAVAAVWVVPPASVLQTPDDRPAAYPWLAAARRDALLTRTRDVQRGTLTGFADDPPGVTLKPPAGDATTVPLSTLAAVGLDPGLARVRPPRGPFARLVLTDGSRLSLTTATAADGRLTGTTAWGCAVTLPLADLVSLHVERGPAVYLSDLKPTAEVTAYTGVAWPWRPDRAATGRPLTLRTPAGVETFDRGLGTHSRTRLRYDLAGRYQRFEAVVGLDPVAGKLGQAAVTVSVDGKPARLPRLRTLTADQFAEAITVNVTGAKVLELLIDYGEGGDVQDHVNWGDARLIRALSPSEPRP